MTRPSLYVHLPFCVAKCGYCDFNSHPGEGRNLDVYAKALIEEARLRAPHAPPTVFVGGGTPTYFSLDLLRRLFAELRGHGAFADPSVEVTVEANPESATLDKLQCLREGGVNRLSIGVQSFQPRYLRDFERVHDVEAVVAAVDNARKAGFTRVNLDLIFAKPDESLEMWLGDLRAALALAPEHLSCYELMYEEGTTLTRQYRRGQVAAIDEDSCAEQYHATVDALGAEGFEAYEVSAFARQGEECRHNLVYWTSGNWVGIGAGAGTSVGPRKFLNVKSPEAYSQSILDAGSAIDGRTEEQSTPHTRLAEVLMMGLRLLDGIPLSTIAERTGLDVLSTYPDRVSRLVEEGLIVVEAGWIRTTPRGRDLLNVVASRFLPDC